MNEKMILVDFDGTPSKGLFLVYPANDDSVPDFDFPGEFAYGIDCAEDGCFETKAEARSAAHAEAQRVAKLIGGDWATNE